MTYYTVGSVYCEPNYFSIAMFIMQHNAICTMVCLICVLSFCGEALPATLFWKFFPRVEIIILLHVGGRKANNLSG